MAIATNFYGPLTHCSIVDCLPLFSFECLFAVVGTTTVAAIGFFFFRHILDYFEPNFFFLSVSFFLEDYEFFYWTFLRCY